MVEALALGFDRIADLVVEALLLHPHRETGRAVLLREAGGVEHDAEERQAAPTPRARAKRPGR